jgi:iron complex transport system substrate-binding protein
LTLIVAFGALLVTACASATPESNRQSSSPAQGHALASSTTETGVTYIHSADLPAPAPLMASFTPTAPTRIVALAVGSGETVAALGAGAHVVGRDETSSAPQIETSPVLTKAHVVSAEKVIALRPDVVLVDEMTSPPEALDQIRAAGIRVVSVPQAWTMADMPARVQSIAEAIGAVNGDELARQFGAAPSIEPSTARPRVAFLYLRGTSAIYLLGGKGSGADDLIARSGGIDVGAEAGLAAFTPLTAEALAQLNPDILLVMSMGLESVGGPDGLMQLPGVAQTAAGRSGRVIAVDDTVLLSFGPRTSALVDALAKALR